MPPIRRALTFLILILFFFVLVQLSSPNALQPLFRSHSSYTGNVQPLELQLDPPPSTSTQVETSVPGSEVVTGFTLLDRLYLRNGTFFIVTANQSVFPPKRNMIAPGMDMGAGHDTEPTDKVLSYSEPCGIVKSLNKMSRQGTQVC